ncbi:assimilatory nitrite reductase small subunit [Sorangium cellulosum]|uniref:Assimilatory nitrite reductase small subunit n=1 Tax=Sorangium cellulosum TaxID=56 RepID=A0A2L0ELU3_SORCE|nr:Rieske (2Fe-2S) protein [Sorangium cellulosum]AUX40267.1 assimilatory nitrite reductase small subunit [Sorangium cellulosum]
MKPDWIDLGPLSEFPAETPVLRKDGEGRRFACVLRGGEVHALDDRCPHQGYPLSQGALRGGVLTCAWHNWKFDVASGACTFGGEPVRRYATRVDGGRVLLNRAVDTAGEVRRLVAGLREAVLRDDPARALREGLRLGALGLHREETGLGSLHLAFEVLARDGAERAEHGFDHGLALLADLCSWIERGWIPPEEAFVVAAHAVGEASARLGPRGKGAGKAGARSPLARLADFEHDDPVKVSEALAAERRDEAEARMRELVEVRGPAGARRALLPFLTQHLYDYGHGAIFLSKAIELAGRFPAAAEEVLAASTVQLAWATADTGLPPFAATRAALARLAALPLPGPRDAAGSSGAAPAPAPLDPAERAAFEAEVLAGERPAAEAAVGWLERGAPPLALLGAVGHAAAIRLARFDAAWEQRLDAEVSVLDVTHAVTFAEAAAALAREALPREAAQLAVLAAAFVGRLRDADAAAPPAPPTPAARPSGALLQAVEARDVGGALAIARELDAAGRLRAYADLAPFAAFDAAVRPIFTAHAVKTLEALQRLESADPQPDGAYLEALLTYLAPARRELHVRRIAAVAKKFMRDGRPPEGLY